jgi:hypothetical protein
MLLLLLLLSPWLRHLITPLLPLGGCKLSPWALLIKSMAHHGKVHVFAVLLVRFSANLAPMRAAAHGVALHLAEAR